ncbi:MAG TPA: ATP-binding protein [Gaiellaceae bacterium]|nr:ATP-binding protein [Gaiellaceae bacterium]
METAATLEASGGRGGAAALAADALGAARETTTAQAERFVAWLRAAAIPVLALGETLAQPDREPVPYYSVLTAYAVFACLVLVWLSRWPADSRFSVAATAGDVAAIATLAALSGGAFSPVRSAFFLLPVTVAFRFRPALTAAAAAAAVLAYLVQALAHPSASAPHAPREIAVRAGFLALTGVSASVLSWLLERRTRRVAELSSTSRLLETRYRELFRGVPLGLFRLDARGGLVEANPALLELLGATEGDAAAALPPSLPFPSGDEEGWLRLAGEGRVRGLEFDAEGPDGEGRRLRTTGRALRNADGRAVGYEGSLEDVTDRRRVELELELRARQQAVVAELARLSLSVDVHALTVDAADAVARTLDVPFVKVLELEADRRSLLLRAGVGWRDGVVGRARVSGARSQAAVTLRSREPLVTADLGRETRFQAPRLLLDHGIRSGVSVVIGGFDAPYGVLGAHSRERKQFSVDDARFLEAVAGVIAAAIERARADDALAAGRERFAASRQRLLADVLAAEERERRLLAESLHDRAIQSLVAARQDLHETAAGDPDAFGRADLALRETIGELREAIFELDPRVYVQAGVEQALRAATLRAARRGRFEPRVSVSGDLGSHEPLLLGVARQLLANIAEHAGARRVAVRVVRRRRRVVLVVADDGCGFDAELLPQRVAAGHIGLLSQRERVESAGGVFRIRTSPGRGTTVVVSLPVEAGSVSQSSDSPPPAGGGVTGS